MNARSGHPATPTMGQMIRTSDAAMLAHELVQVRRMTLAIFDAYVAAGALHVPRGDEFNPPLWELGHIGWFQQWWVGRNQQRHLGAACDPLHVRLSCPHLKIANHGDDWYNSSTMPQAQRWDLPLLPAQTAKSYLQSTLEQTLQCLAQAGSHDDDLYFYRLVLLHEAMHFEAAVYMAQALQIPFELPQEIQIIINSVALHAVSTGEIGQLRLNSRAWKLGTDAMGFAFDNELVGQTISLLAFEIDARPVSWAQYMAFVEATSRGLPRYVRRAAAGYQALQFGRWQALDLQQSAVHLSWYEAQAYCQWAGRRLPLEAEWECAAHIEKDFAWGQVWEWTSSCFAPYDGFKAHPYREYSEPWFGSRKVLRGACAATLPIMANAKYRNYFLPDRTDIYSGFRTCAI